MQSEVDRALKRVRLELARDHDFPNGSRSHGYEFAAPLDDTGHLVSALWKAHRAHCIVKRFWGEEAARIGHLVHKPGGAWVFDYDPTRADDDEAGFKLDRHSFRPGDYVSFREEDGVMRTFRVISVEDL